MGGGNGKRWWRISFHRSSSSSSDSKLEPKQPPKDFLCPISGMFMSDPVVVTSGHTFERVAVQVCRDLKFTPSLEDGSRPDFSTVIPNLAIRSTISNWCKNSGLELPRAPEYSSVESVVRLSMASQQDSPDLRVSERELLRAVADNPPLIISHAATELGPRVNHFDSFSSEESVIVVPSPGTPLHLTTRPACYSSSSSSSVTVETEFQNPNGPISEEEDKLVSNMKSNQIFEQEEAVKLLRSITRNRESTRISLCTPRLLDALRPLIASEYPAVQVNAVASLVNLSLEKANKVKIIRRGFAPHLINVMKGGSDEAQEHAAGALFSLALNEDNRMAIGALGAFQPLMHALRSESERTRNDAALALYNLTLVPSNRVKLVRLGAIPTLLAMLKSGKLRSRVLLILCNLAACTEGQSAMLDSNAVECLVSLLKEKELDPESTRENCVSALYALSRGSLRFRAVAKEAKVMHVLKEVEERGTERAREKGRRIVQMLRAGGEDEEDGNGSNFDLDSGGLNWNRFRGRNINGANSTAF